MKLVVIESPFAGDVDRNVAYARAAIRDCLRRGEAGYASHLFYPQVLDDANPNERALGIKAGFCWGERAELRTFYVDCGLSAGMRLGMREAIRLKQRTEIRSLRFVPMTSWLSALGDLSPEDRSVWTDLIDEASPTFVDSVNPG